MGEIYNSIRREIGILILFLLLDFISWYFYPPSWTWDWSIFIIGVFSTYALNFFFRSIRIRLAISLLNILATVIFTPILEELIFRNLIIRLMMSLNINIIWTVFTSSIIFALAHVDVIFSRFWKNNVLNFIDILISGLIFAVVFILSNYSLLIVLFLHAFTNLLIILHKGPLF